MLRWKRCEASDPCCVNPDAPFTQVKKLQWIYAYDSDNDKIYWEWKDVEIVEEYEPDFDEDDR